MSFRLTIHNSLLFWYINPIKRRLQHRTHAALFRIILIPRLVFMLIMTQGYDLLTFLILPQSSHDATIIFRKSL